MDKTDKQIISATVAIVAPLAVFAVVLKIKSRKLQTRMNLREDIMDLLQKAKTAGTDEETEQLVAQALAAWDALDSKTFKRTFSE